MIGSNVGCSVQVYFKSPNMEREGLRRALHSLDTRANVTEVTTDAAPAIMKMLGITNI